MTIRKLVILLLGIFAAGGLALSSCTKNDDTTIVPVGTEYYMDDIFSVIPDSLRSKFFAAFGDVPTGEIAIPPKIEGSYVVDPKQRVATNMTLPWNLETVEPNVYLRFTKQHNGIFMMDFNESTETVTDTVFVQGEDQNFVVYVIEHKDYEMGSMKRGVIMKGKMTAEGISDFRYATIVMETEDYSNGQYGLYPKGTFFIYKDGDGLAKNLDW